MRVETLRVPPDFFQQRLPLHRLAFRLSKQPLDLFFFVRQPHRTVFGQ